MDGKAGAFFRQARRGGFWPVHRSTVTQARAKGSWTAEQVDHDAVRLAHERWPASGDVTWLGLSVLAIIAGARYRRLAAEALRHAFDPDSRLDHLGQGHDPRCLVSTIDAVFRSIRSTSTLEARPRPAPRREARASAPPNRAGRGLLPFVFSSVTGHPSVLSQLICPKFDPRQLYFPSRNTDDHIAANKPPSKNN